MDSKQQFLFICFLCWLICLGVQIPLPFIELRLAISDFFLLPFLVFILFGKKFIFRSFLLFDFLCCGILFAVGMVQHVLITGKITSYALVNKSIGILVLFTSFLFMINACKDVRSLSRALKVFVVTTGFLNILYLIGYLPLCPEYLRTVFLYGGLRLRGLLVDPNAYGGLLVVAFFLHLPFMHMEPKSWNNRVVFFSLLLGVFLSFSRSAYLAFGAGIALTVVLSPYLRRYTSIAFICALLLVIFIVLSPYGSVLLGRILSTSQLVSRAIIVEAALRAFSEHPFIGVGLGSFFELSQDYGLPWKQIVHNTYIWFLVDFGVIGFFLFLLVFLHVFAMGWYLVLSFRQRRDPFFHFAVVVLASLFAMAVFAASIESLYQRHLWMLLGALEILRKYNREAKIAGSYKVSLV